MHTDFLVIGSGLAGLAFALRAALHGSVVVLSKDQLPESATAYAQGGIASVWGPEDSFEAHVEDTLKAGAGLCHRDVVEQVIRDGPECIRELIALGTSFSLKDSGEEPEYDLGREGGHRHRRILHASDATGRELMRVLVQAARAEANIQLLERHLAIDVLTDSRISPTSQTVSCWGAYVLDLDTGQVRTITSRAWNASTSASSAAGSSGRS